MNGNTKQVKAEVSRNDAKMQYPAQLPKQTHKTIRKIRPINIQKLKQIGLETTVKNAIEKIATQTPQPTIKTRRSHVSSEYVHRNKTNGLSEISSAQAHLTKPSKCNNTANSPLPENSQQNHTLTSPEDRLAHAKSVLSKMLLNKKNNADRLKTSNIISTSTSSCETPAEVNEKLVSYNVNRSAKNPHPYKHYIEEDCPKVLNFHLPRPPIMIFDENVTIIKKSNDVKKKREKKPVTLLQNCVESINDYVKQNELKEELKEEFVDADPTIQNYSVDVQTDATHKMDQLFIDKSDAVIKSETNTIPFPLNTSENSISTNYNQSCFLIKPETDVPIMHNELDSKTPSNLIVLENKILSQDEKIDLTTLGFEKTNIVPLTETMTSGDLKPTLVASPKKECTISEEHIKELSTIIIPPGMCLDENAHQSKKILFKKKGYKNVTFEPIFHQTGGTEKVVQPMRFKVRSDRILDLAKTAEKAVGIDTEESEVICTAVKTASKKECSQIYNTQVTFTSTTEDPNYCSKINAIANPSIQCYSRNEILHKENVTDTDKIVGVGPPIDTKFESNFKYGNVSELIQKCDSENITQLNVDGENSHGKPISSPDALIKSHCHISTEDEDNCISAVEYIANLFKEDLTNQHTTPLIIDDSMFNDSDVKDKDPMNTPTLLIPTSCISNKEDNKLAAACLTHVQNEVDLSKDPINIDSTDVDDVIELVTTDSVDKKGSDDERIERKTSGTTGGKVTVSAETNSKIQIGSIVMINNSNVQNLHILEPEDKNSVTIKYLNDVRKRVAGVRTDQAHTSKQALLQNSHIVLNEQAEIRPTKFKDASAENSNWTRGNLNMKMQSKKTALPSTIKSFLNTSITQENLRYSNSASPTLSPFNSPKNVIVPTNNANISDENDIAKKLYACNERRQYGRYLRKTKVNLVQRRKLPPKLPASKTKIFEALNEVKDEEKLKTRAKEREDEGTSKKLFRCFLSPPSRIVCSNVRSGKLSGLKESNVLDKQSEDEEVCGGSKELIDSAVLSKTQSALEMIAEACERHGHVSNPIQTPLKEETDCTVSPQIVSIKIPNFVQHERHDTGAFRNNKKNDVPASSCSQIVQEEGNIKVPNETDELKMEEDLEIDEWNNTETMQDNLKSGMQGRGKLYHTENVTEKEDNENRISTVHSLSKRYRLDSDVNENSTAATSNYDDDMNDYYEMLNDDSSQGVLVKSIQKRLRKTIDGIKKRQTVAFDSDTDSDNVDEHKVDMLKTSAEPIANVIRDNNMKVASTYNSCEYQHEVARYQRVPLTKEVLNKIRVRTLEPFITRTSISHSIPLKKRWDLGRKPYEETDITDDTSPADDEDDEMLREIKSSSNFSKVQSEINLRSTSQNVFNANTQLIRAKQVSFKEVQPFEESKCQTSTIYLHKSNISMKKKHEETLRHKLNTSGTNTEDLNKSVSPMSTDVSLRSGNITTEHPSKDKSSISKLQNMGISNEHGVTDCLSESISVGRHAYNDNDVIMTLLDKIQKPSLSSLTSQKRKRGRPKRVFASVEEHNINTAKRLRSEQSTKEKKLYKDKLLVQDPTNDHSPCDKHKVTTIKETKRFEEKTTLYKLTKDHSSIGKPTMFKEKKGRGRPKRRSSKFDNEQLSTGETISKSLHTEHSNANDKLNLSMSRGRPKRLSNLNNDELKLTTTSSDRDALDEDLDNPGKNCSNLDVMFPLEESVPKKGRRGRKPAISHISNDIGENVTAIPTFNSRLLLIRNRSQLDTNEVITEVSQSGNSKGILKCGLCLSNVNSVCWTDHLAEHYGIGWVAGEVAININERSVVLATIINYMKANPTKILTCRMCPRQYRSALGILLHIEMCGATPQRITCEFCGKSYSKLSLPVHQRACVERIRNTKKGNDNGPETKVNGDVFNNSGRLKRISSRKAESKLKTLIEEDKTRDNTDVNFTKHLKYYAPLDIEKYRRRWADDLQKISEAQCPFRICKFRSSKVDVVTEHIEMCKYQIRPGFHCKLCKIKTIFKTHSEAILHMKEKHNTCRDVDSEDNDGFSEDVHEDHSFSTDSNISSEVETDEADEENPKFIERKCKKTSPIFHNKLYTQRTNDMWSMAKNKWTEFTQRNYAITSLYEFLSPNYFKARSETISQFQDISMIPMKYAFDNNLNFKNAKCYSAEETNSSVKWSTLKRFESTKFQEDCFLFIGGAVKTVRWIPLPTHVEDQYLAVIYREDMDDYSKFLEPTKKANFILLFKIKKKLDESKATSIESVLHYVIHIPEGPVQDIAFMPSGGYDEDKNRLALLAVGTALGCISIFTVPIKLNGNKFNEPGKTNLIDLSADYVLCLEISDKFVSPQCTSIRWSETTAHNLIFASFANGFMGIWDISEKENLNRLESDDKRICYVPLSFFYVGEKYISSFDVHYDTNGPRWIGIITVNRRFIVYDIRDMAHPSILKSENCKTSMFCLDWSPIWGMIPVGYCDIMHCGRSVIAMNPLNLMCHNIKIDNMLSGVSSIHYSPLQNVLVCGTDNGDLVFLNPREYHFEDILSYSMKNTRAIAIMKIQLLNSEPLKRLQLIEGEVELCDDDAKIEAEVSQNNGDNIKIEVNSNWQMFDDEYVKKYGLIFGSTLKYQQAYRDDYYSIERKPSPNLNRYLRISTTRFNMNKNSECLVAIGYENGFLRIMDFSRSSYFE